MAEVTKGAIQQRLKAEGIDDETIQKVFDYHSKNPDLFKRFEHYAKEVAQANKRIGAMAIVNRIRWEAEIENKGDFKINNNIAPYFARIFTIKYPQFSWIFETRAAQGVKVLA